MSQFRVNTLLPPTDAKRQADANARLAEQMRVREEQVVKTSQPQPEASSPKPFFRQPLGQYIRGKGRKSRKLGNKFNRCVKSVRSTVRARKGSNKESAAIAICVKSVLHTRGKTMKRYQKGRLITQKKFRGGSWTGTCS